MKALLTVYRVLATIVGLSIITLTLVGIPLKYAHDVLPDLWPAQLEDGQPLQHLGTEINEILGTAHGFIYMVFLLVALLLAARARWTLAFTVVTLLCGTVPIVSFWAEHRAVRRVWAKHPETAPARLAAGAA